MDNPFIAAKAWWFGRSYSWYTRPLLWLRVRLDRAAAESQEWAEQELRFILRERKEQD